MRALPLEVGTIHFVGIGGIGMSGIAEILHNLGYAVQGSDAVENANTQRLAGLGIAVRIGQRAGNGKGCQRGPDAPHQNSFISAGDKKSGAENIGSPG